MKTVVIGTRAEAAEIKDVIAITDRAEAALEMVRYKLAERVVISKAVLGCRQAEALKDFMGAFYPRCQTDFIGSVREVNDDDKCGDMVVLIVYSVKGGTGCTTLACNIGAHIQSTAQTKTAILDFSRPLGDVHIHLDVSPDTTVVDCLPFVDSPGTLNIETVMKPHESGLMVLCGINESRLAQLAEEDKLERIAELACSSIGVLIIDIGCQPELALRLAAGLRADVKMVLVVTPDVSCLSRARHLLRDDSQRVQSWVVLNNWPKDACITDQEAWHFIPKQRVAGKIGGFQHQVGRSVVEGKPLAMSEPGGQFMEAVSGICSCIVPGLVESVQPSKDGWFHHIVKKVKR